MTARVRARQIARHHGASTLRPAGQASKPGIWRRRHAKKKRSPAGAERQLDPFAERKKMEIFQETDLITIPELAKIIRKSLESIRSDLCRAPHRLPPTVRLPSTRRVLFRRIDVEKWISGYVAVPAPVPPVPLVRRRGRPTKSEQISRGKAAAGRPAAQKSQKF